MALDIQPARGSLSFYWSNAHITNIFSKCYRSPLLHIWFLLGSLLYPFLIIMTLLLICFLLLNSLGVILLDKESLFGSDLSLTVQSSIPTGIPLPTAISESLVQPLIPGITFPTSYIGYFIGALFISVAFHELGHALAAAKEGVAVTGVGVGLRWLSPFAYVETESMVSLHPFRQLKIYTAGVWHNFVLLLTCIFLLWAYLWGLRTFGTTCSDWSGKQCTWLTDIAPESPLYPKLPDVVLDERPVGIHAINWMPVTSPQQWHSALQTIGSSPARVTPICIQNKMLKEASLTINSVGHTSALIGNAQEGGKDVWTLEIQPPRSQRSNSHMVEHSGFGPNGVIVPKPGKEPERYDLTRLLVPSPRSTNNAVVSVNVDPAEYPSNALDYPSNVLPPLPSPHSSPNSNRLSLPRGSQHSHGQLPPATDNNPQGSRFAFSSSLSPPADGHRQTTTATATTQSAEHVDNSKALTLYIEGAQMQNSSFILPPAMIPTGNEKAICPTGWSYVEHSGPDTIVQIDLGNIGFLVKADTQRLANEVQVSQFKIVPPTHPFSTTPSSQVTKPRLATSEVPLQYRIGKWMYSEQNIYRVQWLLKFFCDTNVGLVLLNVLPIAGLDGAQALLPLFHVLSVLLGFNAGRAYDKVEDERPPQHWLYCPRFVIATIKIIKWVTRGCSILAPFLLLPFLKGILLG
eukprot:TRINITY_DN66931_c7_g14_i1.p1 TRINITY_DN66931_c7_g14~~TRINITY_DN66931_c7_g14_i1.p1  ORF type:complete len:687 (-),score=13.17 TRINITY_DN66931_c7_g14_i1:93-2153(-)